ncbi:DNA-formamidopyrimidine glycosylase family protein, partial [Pasteurella multocida]
MPELPEVETTKNGISPYLEGTIIEKIVVRQPKLRWMVSEELAQITQQKVIALSRRAKYLIIQLETGYMIGHLGMSGSLRVVEKSDLIDKHDHIDIVMNNG